MNDTNYTPPDLRRKYNEFAPKYDLIEGSVDKLIGANKLRREWLSQAIAPVLEIGAGTGASLPAYTDVDQVVLVDVSDGMIQRAKRKGFRLGINAHYVQADAHRLPFADNRFHTVVSSFTLCTLSDPQAAVKEMARVCAPGGSLLLIEHGRSHDHRWLNRFLDKRAHRHYSSLGCHWNLNHPRLLRNADLEIIDEERSHLGLIVRLRARPCPPPEHHHVEDGYASEDD